MKPTPRVVSIPVPGKSHVILNSNIRQHGREKAKQKLHKESRDGQVLVSSRKFHWEKWDQLSSATCK